MSVWWRCSLRACRTTTFIPVLLCGCGSTAQFHSHAIHAGREERALRAADGAGTRNPDLSNGRPRCQAPAREPAPASYRPFRCGEIRSNSVASTVSRSTRANLPPPFIHQATAKVVKRGSLRRTRSQGPANGLKRLTISRAYNITRWTQMPHGGHFPAAEEPELLAGELREFFRPHR